MENQVSALNTSWGLSDKIAVIASVVAFLQFMALVSTVIVMVRNARWQLRAYVLPEGGGLFEGTILDPPNPHHADEPGVALTFKNTGQTPAYGYINWAQVAVIEPANEHTLVVPPLQMIYPAAIGAGSQISKFIWYGRALSAAEIADVVAARRYIYVYGRLEYRDAFKRKRWATFRLQYAGPFPPRPGAIFNFSNSGNASN